MTAVFMAASALLTALTVLLFSSLLGAIDHLMEQAQTPDFLQMHTGEISVEELSYFAGEHEERKETGRAGKSVAYGNGMVEFLSCIYQENYV